MASNDAAKVMSGGDTKDCETTIEIKIRTLDSQNYVLRVNKCVPIPMLKKQIATVTGVSSGQQHLIFDGRILEDDQLLSTYHVEDDHTLHLVVRQSHQSATPSTNQMESSAYGHPGTSSASGSGQNREAVFSGSALESGQNRSSQGVHGIFTASGSEHQVFHGTSSATQSGHNLRNTNSTIGSGHNLRNQVAHGISCASGRGYNLGSQGVQGSSSGSRSAHNHGSQEAHGTNFVSGSRYNRCNQTAHDTSSASGSGHNLRNRTSSASRSGHNLGNQVAPGASFASGIGHNHGNQAAHGFGDSSVSGSGHNLGSQVIHGTTYALGSGHNSGSQVAHTSILSSPLSDMLDPINSTDTGAGNRAYDIWRESQQSDIPYQIRCNPRRVRQENFPYINPANPQRDGRQADFLYQNPANPQRDGQQADFLSSSTASVGLQNPTVIASSLSTLSLYIRAVSNMFRREGFVANVEAVIDQNEGQSHDSHMHAAQVGLSSTAYLAELLLSSRQLMEQTRECLYQLAIQLEEHTRLIDPSSRNFMERSAIMPGVLIQNMGLVLLQLGRAILTLQLGRTPAEAQVNAGPAIYTSNTGSAPLMIQVPRPVTGGTNIGPVNLGHGLEVFVVNANVSEQPFSGGDYGIRAVPLRRVVSVPFRRVVVAPSNPSANSAQLASLRQVRAGNVHDTRGSQSSSQIHQGAFGVYRLPRHQSTAQMENSDSSSGGAPRVGGPSLLGIVPLVSQMSHPSNEFVANQVYQQPSHQSTVQRRNLESNSGGPARVVCHVPSNTVPVVSGLSPPPNEFAASQVSSSDQLSQPNNNSERRTQVNNDTTRGTESQDAARVFNVLPRLVEFHQQTGREDLNGSSCSQQRLSPPKAQDPQRTKLSPPNNGQRTQAGSGTIRATKPNDAARGSNVLPQLMEFHQQIEREDLNVSHQQHDQPAAQSPKRTKNQSNNDGDKRSQANDDATRDIQLHDATRVGSDGVFSSNAPHPLMSLIPQDGEHEIPSATPNSSTAQNEREHLNDSSSSQHQRDPFKAPSQKRTKRNND